MKPAVTADPALARTTVALGVLASLAFVALGLPDGLLGVAWPSIRAGFGLPIDALGALLVTFTLGYVSASLLGGRLVMSLGLARLLTLSCAATALSLIGYAASPSWPLVVALGAIAGLGAGGIDTGVNTYAATRHGPRMLNWLHACYGIGAAMGPAIMTLVFAAHASWRWGYAVVGAALFALALAFAMSRRIWPHDTRTDAAGSEHRIAEWRETLGVGRARLSAALFFVYTGLELSVGTWAFTLLTEGRGVPAVTAGSWTGWYWIALTAGRLARAALTARIESAIVLRGAMALLAMGLALVAAGLSPATDLAGLLLSGFAAGPIFPTLIASTPTRVGAPHVANTVGLQIGAAGIGQALVPSLVGVLADALGLEALAASLVALSLVVAGVNELAAAADGFDRR